VPILRDGKLAGIVSRSNLIQAQATSDVAAGSDGRPIAASVASCSTGWAGRHGRTSARARHRSRRRGAPLGTRRSPQEHKALLALAEQVAGVKSVSDETFPAY